MSAPNLQDCCVVVTPRSFGAYDPRMRQELEAAVGRVIYNPTNRPLSAHDLQPLLQDADGYIAGLDYIDATALTAAKRLKVIARYGVGTDRVDLEAARTREIVVTNTPRANSVSVAELTVCLLLALARQLPQSVASLGKDEWIGVNGISLEGKTVGLLGFGDIGKQVARRLGGFDCTLLAYDPQPDTATAQAYGVKLQTQISVVEHSDFLSLHLPLLPATTGMVDAKFLRRMKPGAFLINTARGGLIDESALVAALKSGHIQGAALDVFAVEPPERDNPLLALPQVLATPHIAAHSDSAINAMGWTSLRDCLAVLRGEEPVYRVI